jgi:hypothetical protein
MSDQVVEVIVEKGHLDHPESRVAVPGPAQSSETLTTTSATFTRATFEGALDRVSRPVKGKYKDILPSSEEFIRDKRQEAELEDR